MPLKAQTAYLTRAKASWLYMNMPRIQGNTPLSKPVEAALGEIMKGENIADDEVITERRFSQLLKAYEQFKKSDQLNQRAYARILTIFLNVPQENQREALEGLKEGATKKASEKLTDAMKLTEDHPAALASDFVQPISEPPKHAVVNPVAVIPAGQQPEPRAGEARTQDALSTQADSILQEAQTIIDRLKAKYPDADFARHAEYLRRYNLPEHQEAPYKFAIAEAALKDAKRIAQILTIEDETNQIIETMNRLHKELEASGVNMDKPNAILTGLEAGLDAGPADKGDGVAQAQSENRQAKKALKEIQRYHNTTIKALHKAAIDHRKQAIATYKAIGITIPEGAVPKMPKQPNTVAEAIALSEQFRGHLEAAHQQKESLKRARGDDTKPDDHMAMSDEDIAENAQFFEHADEEERLRRKFEAMQERFEASAIRAKPRPEIPEEGDGDREAAAEAATDPAATPLQFDDDGSDEDEEDSNASDSADAAAIWASIDPTDAPGDTGGIWKQAGADEASRIDAERVAAEEAEREAAKAAQELDKAATIAHFFKAAAEHPEFNGYPLDEDNPPTTGNLLQYAVAKDFTDEEIRAILEAGVDPYQKNSTNHNLFEHMGVHSISAPNSIALWELCADEITRLKAKKRWVIRSTGTKRKIAEALQAANPYNADSILQAIVAIRKLKGKRINTKDGTFAKFIRTYQNQLEAFPDTPAKQALQAELRILQGQMHRQRFAFFTTKRLHTSSSVEAELTEGGPLELEKQASSPEKKEAVTSLYDWGTACNMGRGECTMIKLIEHLQEQNPSTDRETIEQWAPALASYSPIDIMEWDFSFNNFVTPIPFGNNNNLTFTGSNSRYQFRFLPNGQLAIEATTDYSASAIDPDTDEPANLSYNHRKRHFGFDKKKQCLYSVTTSVVLTKDEQGELSVKTNKPTLTLKQPIPMDSEQSIRSALKGVVDKIHPKPKERPSCSSSRP